MSEVGELIKLVKQQMEAMEKQRKEDLEAMKALIGQAAASATTTGVPTSTPSFSPFDSSTELWSDYYSRFCTFTAANSVQSERQAQVFLTNQSSTVYKLLANLAGQQNPPKDINSLSLNEIVEFMKGAYDPKRFVVRERYKFWSDMQRKPGETLQELAARIRQDAATCDFPSIKDSLDEAMRQRFICSVHNEAVLKALFKIKDDELDFTRAVQVAIETDDAARVAKETVYGSPSKAIHQVHKNHPNSKGKHGRSKPVESQGGKSIQCYRCGKGHKAPECPHKETVCNHCNKTGHLESVCFKKKNEGGRGRNGVNKISKADLVKAIFRENVSVDAPKLEVPIQIQNRRFYVELDTATTGNFLTMAIWKQLGKPALRDVSHRYESASKHDLPVLGEFQGLTHDPDTGKEEMVSYIVTKIPNLNLLGRNAILSLGISVDNVLGVSKLCKHNKVDGPSVVPDPIPFTTQQDLGSSVVPFPSPSALQTSQDGGSSSAVTMPESDVTQHSLGEGSSSAVTMPKSDSTLQLACQNLCDDYPDLFNAELGCLKDFELDVKFKANSKPAFYRPRPVPFAIRDDLAKGYDDGITKGVWQTVQFNDYGTPVVLIRKALLPGQLKPKLRICGDYSVAVNDQLEEHRQPIPLPEELMQKLGGGYCYSKIDLADAHNQIQLAPESQKKLALSTHRGVLLQMRLPFGIKSAPGYFQEIMDNLTKDLPGVAVYLDDILVSGKNANDHLQNLRGLLARLHEKGLRCRREKCSFAQRSVEYLGHTLSTDGIARGRKEAAVLKVPAPTNVQELKAKSYSVGDAVYALSYGRKGEREPKWVPAVVTKRLGTRCVNVQLAPHGPTWRRHIVQLQPRYSSEEDAEPGPTESYTDYGPGPLPTDHPMEVPGTTFNNAPPSEPMHPSPKGSPPKTEYGPDTPRRSKRRFKRPERLCYEISEPSGKPSGSVGRCHGPA